MTRETQLRVETVLVLEDQWLIGEDLRVSLEQLGYAVLEPVSTCAAAFELLQKSRPDLAFLDTHLVGETCEAVLDECRRRGIAVVLTSGDTASDLPPFCQDVPFLPKPFGTADIARIIDRHLPA